MGHDADDKSFTGKLIKLRDKLEESMHRRQEENDQRTQAQLTDNVEKMYLQQPVESASRKSRLGESSYAQSGQQSVPLPQQVQYDEQPPQYQQQNSGDGLQPGLGSDKKPKKSLDKPVPSIPFEMGSSSSAAPTSFATNFASLSLHMVDRIRLLDFPRPAIDLARLAIQRGWPRGIADECDYHGSYEFGLHGRPWAIHYGEQGVESRRLTRSIFEMLYDSGWVLALGTDVSRKNRDKDTLIFRHQIPTPARCEWFTIDFFRGDRIRIIDAPKELLDGVYAQLGPAIQELVSPMMPGVWEIKMLGYPWRATGGESMTARRLLLQLFAVLERFGFTVYASVDQESTSSDRSSETDVWQCLRPVGWTPGAPVYHG